jgi:hypothetical protein
MREGHTPQEACESVVRHLVTRVPTSKRHQMAYTAINRDGNFGAAAARPPFPYAVTTKSVNEIRSGFTLLPAIDQADPDPAKTVSFLRATSDET